MLAWSCSTLGGHPGVQRVVVVVPGAAAADPPEWLRACSDVQVGGGESRRQSVARGLEAAGDSFDRVLIHDGARPFVSVQLIDRLLEVETEGGVIPVLPVADTVKQLTADGSVSRTLGRSTLRRVQTPQLFPLSLIRRLHREAEEMGMDAPDDAFLCERAGVNVATVDGEPWNLKITTDEDLSFARWLITTGRVHRAIGAGEDGGAL